MHDDWLMLTKLAPPETRPDMLPRPRLLHALQQAIATRALTLLSAPAGSGKTTLLAALATETADAVFAWLSLDDDDNDPLHFAGGISAALERAGIATVPMPSGGAPAQLRGWLRGLVNAVHMAAPRPLVLLLDDMQWVNTPAIFALLDQLLDHMPPSLRLVIATRHDPPLNVARWRVRRQFTEFRLDELRFTLDEAADLLNTTLALGVETTQLEHLLGRTEGWAAGLSLVATSLERMTTPAQRAAFLTTMGRTERTIFEFLAEEVLNRQDPFIRMFLLETAVLPTLTPALCQAVTGREDADAVLDQLYQRNLFLVALDAQQHASTPERTAPVYRYHDLFRDFLRQRLQRELPEWPARLYRRAAAAERHPASRIQLLLAGALWDAAGAEIVTHGEALLQASSYGLLHRWIDSLPAAVRDARPQLLLLYGIAKWEQYDLFAGRAVLEQALRRFTAIGDQAGRAATLVQLVRTANQTGNLAAVREVAAEVATLPATTDLPPELRVGSVLDLLTTGQWAQVLADLDGLVAAIINEPDPARQQRLFQVLLSYRVGPLTALPDAVPRYERIGRLLEAQPPTALGEQMRLYALSVHIYCHFWRGGWDAAVQGIEELYQLSAALGVPEWSVIDVGGILPMCAAWRGDMVAAEAEFNRLFAWVARIPEQFTIQQVPYLYWQARVRWQQRRYDDVRATAQRIAALEQAHGASPFLAIIQPLLGVLLAIAERRFDAAEATLHTLVALQERMPFSVIFGNVGILLAYVSSRRGRPDDALAQFAPLLATHAHANTPGHLMWEGEPSVVLLRLAVERDTHRAFAERVLQLLATPAAPHRVVLPNSNEALSSREIEVLRLLARGNSNAEIAAHLTISAHTAKRHVANILAKLGATTRTEAASRARDLGLL